MDDTSRDPDGVGGWSVASDPGLDGMDVLAHAHAPAHGSGSPSGKPGPKATRPLAHGDGATRARPAAEAVDADDASQHHRRWDRRCNQRRDRILPEDVLQGGVLHRVLCDARMAPLRAAVLRASFRRLAVMAADASPATNRKMGVWDAPVRPGVSPTHNAAIARRADVLATWRRHRGVDPPTHVLNSRGVSLSEVVAHGLWCDAVATTSAVALSRTLLECVLAHAVGDAAARWPVVMTWPNFRSRAEAAMSKNITDTLVLASGSGGALAGGDVTGAGEAAHGRSEHGAGSTGNRPCGGSLHQAARAVVDEVVASALARVSAHSNGRARVRLPRVFEVRRLARHVVDSCVTACLQRAYPTATPAAPTAGAVAQPAVATPPASGGAPQPSPKSGESVGAQLVRDMWSMAPRRVSRPATSITTPSPSSRDVASAVTDVKHLMSLRRSMQGRGAGHATLASHSSPVHDAAVLEALRKSLGGHTEAEAMGAPRPVQEVDTHAPSPLPDAAAPVPASAPLPPRDAQPGGVLRSEGVGGTAASPASNERADDAAPDDAASLAAVRRSTLATVESAVAELNARLEAKQRRRRRRHTAAEADADADGDASSVSRLVQFFNRAGAAGFRKGEHS